MSVDKGININPLEIPAFISLDEEKNYSLLGITLFKTNHFYLKIFSEGNFYDYDNLKATQGSLNNKSGQNWEINYAFYQKIVH